MGEFDEVGVAVTGQTGSDGSSRPTVQVSAVLGPHPATARAAPRIFVLVAAALVAVFVALLWVSSYANRRPTLGGFPFFYWYTLLWLLITIAVEFLAYRFVVVAPPRRRERASRRNGAAPLTLRRWIRRATPPLRLRGAQLIVVALLVSRNVAILGRRAGRAWRLGRWRSE